MKIIHFCCTHFQCEEILLVHWPFLVAMPAVKASKTEIGQARVAIFNAENYNLTEISIAFRFSIKMLIVWSKDACLFSKLKFILTLKWICESELRFNRAYFTSPSEGAEYLDFLRWDFHFMHENHIALIASNELGAPSACSSKLKLMFQWFIEINSIF